MRLKPCRGRCDALADGLKGRYDTGLRYCVKCCFAFRLLRRCPCCGNHLRRHCKGSVWLERKHRPDTRIVVPPPRQERPNRLKDPNPTPQRARNRDSWRRYYWRDPDAARARRRERYWANVEKERANMREHKAKKRLEAGIRPGKPGMPVRYPDDPALARRRELYQANIDKRRARAREWARKHRLRLGMVPRSQGGGTGPRVTGMPVPVSIR